jgi:hypothetical protein
MSYIDLALMPLLFVGVPIIAAWAYAVRQTVRASRRASQSGGSTPWRRVVASFRLGSLILAGFLIVSLGPPWFMATVSRSLIRQTEIGFLGVAEVVYETVVVIATVALFPLAAVAIRRRTPGRAGTRVDRSLVLAFSILVAAGLAEGVAAACLWASSVPMPWLPFRFKDRTDDSVVDVLVIGESSAQGVPYENWFSAADIVAWKLGEAFPQRVFRVENQAAPGLSLQAMHSKLRTIERRPELVILYAGHNEFQSRFHWAHAASHYVDERPLAAESLQGLARRVSPVCRLIQANMQRIRISTPPSRVVTRQLVDVPVYTCEQYAERLKEFRIRLGAIVSYLEWIGAQVVLVIPPGNDVGFEPNRSFLSSTTSRAQREAFASEFAAARGVEATDPEEAEKGYRRLLGRQPGFAESHFRLARLLERDGEWDEAFRHYVSARDLDGLPMRMPSDFARAYADVAARHPHAILIDGPAEFRASADHGLAADVFFTDGLHPSLNGYTVLAQAILKKLRENRLFGWSAEAPFPFVTPLDCAKHFRMDATKWEQICGYSAWFYDRTAFIRHDPAARLAKAATYREGVRQLHKGTPVNLVRVPGVGPRATPPTLDQTSAIGSRESPNASSFTPNLSNRAR